MPGLRTWNWPQYVGGAKDKVTGSWLRQQSEALGPPLDGEFESAWAVTEALLAEMDKDVKQHSARFLIVLVTSPLQVYPGKKERHAIQKKLGVTDALYINHRLEEFGQSHRIDILSLAEPFMDYADAHKVFLHGFANTAEGFGHWNENGHLLAGHAIAIKACQYMIHDN